jgi:formylglycine-generating enzyme required for sulfatase activity
MARFALLIGVSDYEDGFGQLPAAIKDIEAIREVLVNPEIGDFMETNVTLLPNPSRQEMADAIYTLFANRQKEDLVLLYFSGHGVLDEGNRFYFASRHTRKDQGKLIPTTALEASTIQRFMEESRSHHQVMILDSCFSGAFAKGMHAKDSNSVNLEQILGGRGRAILTASTSTQYALTQEGFELSIYTHFLVEGLRTGGADQGGDGQISAEALHMYVKDKVREAAPAMTPEFYPVKEGYKIILAKSPRNDPALEYRKEVQKRVHDGHFSVPARKILDLLQHQLNLHVQVSEGIEAEVLRPYKEHRRKVEEYEYVLVETLIGKTTLIDREKRELKDLQQYLGLLDKDVSSIEQKYLGHSIVVIDDDLISTGPVADEIPSTSHDFSTFSFEVVLLNQQGKIISRQPGQVEYFVENLGNDVALEMVMIQGGSFQMGSKEDLREQPVHTVTVTPFWLGKYTVTQTQYKAVMGANPSHFNGVKRPVDSVSWHDSIRFCQLLSEKTGCIYRLPSEAEWEYACRAGTITSFYCGNMITANFANFNRNKKTLSSLLSSEQYLAETKKVGSTLPNAFGIYDMHGNIWEWCQDHWHTSYRKAPKDGSAWLTKKLDTDRVVRGGSWGQGSEFCRSASRLYRHPDDRTNLIGFRVVCENPKTS